MAEHDTSQERTEQPTPKRLQDAKKKGQAARSRELNTTAVLLSGAGAMIVFGGAMGEKIAGLMINGLTLPRELAYDPRLVPTVFGESAMAGLLMLLPLFAAVLVATLAGPAALGGLVFSAESIKPKLEKLSPIAGLKRIFSLNGLMEFAKTLVKFVFVTGAGLLVLYHLTPELLMAGESSVETAVPGLAATSLWVLLVLSAVMLLVAAVDVPFQLWNHNKQLRMTRQEVRDELKETEGRPEVKGRIRRIQAEMSQRRMMMAVPEADVVVTNPTHYSVALKYDPAGMAAPRVVAKGADEIALKIREVAAASGVPRLEAPPLARALYFTTRLDQEIPAELFLAVARVLAWVYQLRTAGAAAPPPPDGLDVPDHLTRRQPGRRI
ncbi:flagellar biosynthesis protein FlhB [Thioalkalivibrio sp. XN8]|uniref:flagellar biosynthesis protein FlhB n=1 Tax=Thioalkalivibrio sp. XN8 TaxID=2712863 RepID=UPI0013ED3791|nr:flagellar biosynthesis protein FlhB [Thioalkalivibrio sp. XN8]NGP52519.1 flagellar biosynthesis protein FlhB [Thioalkalivibrio sp. XN8]